MFFNNNIIFKIILYSFNFIKTNSHNTILYQSYSINKDNLFCDLNTSNITNTINLYNLDFLKYKYINNCKYHSILIPLFEIRSENDEEIPEEFVSLIDFNSFSFNNSFNNEYILINSSLKINSLTLIDCFSDENKNQINMFKDNVNFLIYKNPLTECLTLYGLLTLTSRFEKYFIKKNEEIIYNYNGYTFTKQNSAIKNIELNFNIDNLINKGMLKYIAKIMKIMVYIFLIFPN